MKEIIAGPDQGKAAKAAPARSHQHGAISMAGVIAAQQKRSIRKMMPVLHRERTIHPEERPAETLETETARRRCPESVMRAVPSIHLRQDIKQTMNL